MASWVLSISEDFPQHWRYAVRHGMWDLRKHRDIQAGDLIYFWQSGSKGGWVGRSVADEDAYPIDVETVEPGPWDDWPGDPAYRSRFAMTVLDSTPAQRVPWGQVRKDLGTNINPGWVYPFSPRQEEVLASYFSSSVAEKVLEQLVQDTASPTDDIARLDLHLLTDDQRELVKKFVAIREGQGAFRQALLGVYDGCAVTGTRLEAALDAAHISPYKGQQSNKVRNGLILRKDIHRLFDLDLLTLEDDGTIRVAPEVSEPIYRELDGMTARLPADETSRPDPVVLQAHRAQCPWLPETPAGPGSADDDHVLF
ncbi:HNH endonuclease [Ornithinimicrobium sp. W1679]|uniref:HNH endonuclease n=1 Tax=Ornithinimicrobium sp. W1679 TaxID=3418770 RepID=UPI003CEF75D2